MPLGESAASKFFTPSHGMYAVRLMGIRDGKQQTYSDGKTGTPAIWSVALYDANGQPIRDPQNPQQIPAIAEAMSGQSTGFGKDGRPAKGRVWLTPFTTGLGLAFPDEANVKQVGALVSQCIGAWAWWTFGPNPDKTSKTTTIVREVAPMIPQPAPSPLPLIVAAAAAPIATPPPSFAPAPAAPVFAQPAPVAEPVAPAAPVFAAPVPVAPAIAEALAPVFAAPPAAPVFAAPVAAAPVAAAPSSDIPPMVFPA